MLRRSRLAGLAIVLVVLLSACVEATRLPAAEPSPSVAPLFASDEEALAAAVEAYEEYLAALDLLLIDPSQSSESLDAVARDQALESAKESHQEFSENGYRLSAPRTLGSAVLQQVFTDSLATSVVAYFCEDIQGVELLDSDGTSLSEADRPDFTTFAATVEFDIDGAFVTEREFWGNESSC